MRLGLSAEALLLLTVGALAPAHALDGQGVVHGTATIQYAFSPDGNAAKLVISAIDSARREVLVQAFSFTHGGIANALVRAHSRGANVQVIADPGQIELIGHNVVGVLVDAGVPVYTDAAHSAAHDKIMVIDAEEALPLVVTGSFNFTLAAQYRNAENVLVISGNRELVQAYLENWKRHRAHAARYGR